MYLLDTNICIYFMKDSYPELTAKILSHDPADLSISAVTVYELEYGAEKSKWGERNRLKMALFLAPFSILDLTSEDALCAGRVRADLEQKGMPIGPYDIQLAGQALARKLTLITHNTAEFGRVPGLLTEDWVNGL